MTNKYYNDRIFIWTKNPDIIKFSKEIAKDLKTEVYEADCEPDLIMIPAFIYIIDTEKLKEDFLLVLNQHAKFWNPDECSIVIYGKRLTNVPFYVNPLITYLKRPVTKEALEKLIKKVKKQKKTTKQEIFKKRITRIIHLYKKLEEGDVNIEAACIYYEISPRTLRRDISVLRDACDEEIFSDKKRGYYFDNKKGNQFEIKAKLI